MPAPDRTMFPLDPTGAEHARSWVGEPCGRGLLDLHHALAHCQPGLWGDDAREPRSVLLVREGTGQVEAFGAGEPEPAVSWIVRRQEKAVALLAPKPWWELVRLRARVVERVELAILAAGAGDVARVASAVATRRLTQDDADAFLASEATPDWALFAWGSFAELIEHGAAFGVPFGPGFAALAWTYSQAGRYAAIGVSTTTRFRGLGLGRAAAAALVAELVDVRGKVALWTTAPGNAASHRLGRSLGFSLVGTETYLRWQAIAGALAEDGGPRLLS